MGAVVPEVLEEALEEAITEAIMEVMLHFVPEQLLVDSGTIPLYQLELVPSTLQPP